MKFMNLMPNKLHEELLLTIPDFSSWEEAQGWIQKGQQLADQLSTSHVAEAEYASLEWSDIEQKREFPFGLYASEKWRKFVLATFLADLVSYANPVDQVNFERLLFVMHAFPQGFRTWWVKLQHQTWLPVGYTAWYPMLDTMYELFEQNPEKLKDRMVVPNTAQDASKLYLFNFSAIPILKDSRLSHQLIKQFADDVNARKAKGLSCITVSEDGARIAERFGMAFSGNLILEGCPEGVYVTKREDA